VARSSASVVITALLRRSAWRPLRAQLLRRLAPTAACRPWLCSHGRAWCPGVASALAGQERGAAVGVSALLVSAENAAEAWVAGRVAHVDEQLHAVADAEHGDAGFRAVFKEAWRQLRRVCDMHVARPLLCAPAENQCSQALAMLMVAPVYGATRERQWRTVVLGAEQAWR